MRLARIRHGNALILVLGIALLLGIQVYIIQTFTAGSFRHVERVNAHIRAIYVGEAAFSCILAKLKADTWENRWFKGIEYRDFSQPIAGGTYSSVVIDVPPTPGVTDKLVDVWLEARYEGSTSVMYYRVSFADDTLDFTAQVYPRFFTFLEASDPNPFTGGLAPALAHINGLIQKQKDNEAQAVAAINTVKTTCNLSGVGTQLGIAFPSTPLDAITAPGGSLLDLCGYVNGVRGTLNSLLPPPLALPLPVVPPPPLPGANFVEAVRGAFLANAGGAVLPVNKGEKITDPKALALFADTKEAEQQWKTEHFDKNFEHYMKKEEMIGFIENMLQKRDSAPASTEATQINLIVTQLMAWITTQSLAAGGRTYTTGDGTLSAIVAELEATKRDLPPRIPEFREKED